MMGLVVLVVALVASRLGLPCVAGLGLCVLSALLCWRGRSG